MVISFGNFVVLCGVLMTRYWQCDDVFSAELHAIDCMCTKRVLWFVDLPQLYHRYCTVCGNTCLSLSVWLSGSSLSECQVLPSAAFPMHAHPLDLAELNLPKTCETKFPDKDDLLHFKLVITPDEVRGRCTTGIVTLRPCWETIVLIVYVCGQIEWLSLVPNDSIDVAIIAVVKLLLL